MTQSNNDIEELEELLTELEGQEARLVAPYSEDDDAVTQLMDAPLGDQEWMVQVTALDRRMMSTDQLIADLQAGRLSSKTLVWRGGMDDWLPIARVEGLAQASAPVSSPAPRMGMNLTAAPASLPAPPMWSTLPSAPLGPPPAALPPNLSPPSALPSSPSMGLGLPPVAASAVPQRSSQTGLPRPVASLPPPPAVSSGNTTRPVAVDFSDMMPEDTTSPLRGKRAVMALSAVAVLAVFVSAYALSSKSDGTASAEPAVQPRAVSALQPAASEKKAESVPAKPVEPAPEAAAKPSEAEMAANDAPAPGARTNAPARYSPKAEYRRRSRGSAAERPAEEAEAESASPAPAAAVAARATAPAAEEPAAPEVASAASLDDADSAEAPKSTGKSSGTFNRDAAKQALDEAATQARNCRPAGGPSGSGQVQVRYEPSGKVAAVQILTGKFENTTTGSCVKMLFRRAKVPEFTGAPLVSVVKKFEIP